MAGKSKPMEQINVFLARTLFRLTKGTEGNYGNKCPSTIWKIYVETFQQVSLFLADTLTAEYLNQGSFRLFLNSLI